MHIDKGYIALRHQLWNATMLYTKSHILDDNFLQTKQG